MLWHGRKLRWFCGLSFAGTSVLRWLVACAGGSVAGEFSRLWGDSAIQLVGYYCGMAACILKAGLEKDWTQMQSDSAPTLHTLSAYRKPMACVKFVHITAAGIDRCILLERQWPDGEKTCIACRRRPHQDIMWWNHLTMEGGRMIIKYIYIYYILKLTVSERLHYVHSDLTTMRHPML